MILTTQHQQTLLHAGFEDYAKPIVDAIDPQRKYITHTLYRDATLATEHYQCVKDMNRLNRPLEVSSAVVSSLFVYLKRCTMMPRWPRSTISA